MTDAIRSAATVVLESRAANVRRYPHMVTDTDSAGLAATASIPLLIGTEVLGAIGVGWARPLHPEAALLDRFEAVARLTAETLARTRTSDTHAALVAALQKRMVPPLAVTGPSLDAAVRYQPAGKGLGFGGDWYDVIALDSARTAVVVGDVVGHGIDAAAAMVVVRSALNAVVQLRTPLEEIFSLTGRVIDGPANAYIGTAVVLVVDPQAELIGYASAGHPPVLIAYPDGHIRRLDDAQGPALGIGRRASAASAPFPPGAVAIAYTDGLVETRRRSIDDGITRLATAALAGLKAPDDAQGISDRIVASLGDLSDLADDVALVVLRHAGA